MTLNKHHASMRWAKAVVDFIDSPEDARTNAAWARAISVGAGTLRNWCLTLMVSPMGSRDLARLLRALYKSRNYPTGTLEWRPHELLDIVDRRSMEIILSRGGLNGIPRPTLEQFLFNQKLIRNTNAIDAVRDILRERDII